MAVSTVSVEFERIVPRVRPSTACSRFAETEQCSVDARYDAATYRDKFTPPVSVRAASRRSTVAIARGSAALDFIMQEAAEDVAVSSSTALALPPGGGAPAPNELTSSADEADDDDDDDGAAAPELLVAGGWAVLHGLSSEPRLNGVLVRVCGVQPPTWWPERLTQPAKPGRVFIQVVPDDLIPSLHATGRMSVRLTNLHATTVKDALGCLIHAWIDSGPSTPTFAVPAWQALSELAADTGAKEMRADERGKVHNQCKHACTQRGIAVEAVTLPNEHDRGPNRRVELRLTAPPPADGASSSGSDDGDASSLRSMRFVELCTLLEAVEGVDQSRKGFNERRLHQLTAFWRGGGGGGGGGGGSGNLPRHLRRNLFDVVRLLLPHNDSRRYIWGTAGLAKAVGQAMLQDGRMAKKLADTWLDGSEWAIGVPRDLSLVLSAEWGRRSRLRAGAVRVTVGEVNSVLNLIDRAHPGRGHGKAHKLAQLITGRCSRVEIKWLVRILERNLLIGERPAMPVAHKGEWPKLVMDSLCRARGRIGTPSTGNPPLMYACFRHQHSLSAVCAKAESGELPAAYPPPTSLGVHIRAQGSVPCTSTADGAVLDRFVFRRAETERRLLVETKYDGFRLQVHYDRSADRLRFFYRSGIDSTAEIASDLEPAMRLALGAPLAEPLTDRSSGDVLRPQRFGWLARAEREAFDSLGAPPTQFPPRSVILDGELLVYDEGCTVAVRRPVCPSQSAPAPDAAARCCRLTLLIAAWCLPIMLSPAMRTCHRVCTTSLAASPASWASGRTSGSPSSKMAKGGSGGAGTRVPTAGATIW